MEKSRILPLSGAFTLYDIDGDGVITYNEMLKIVKSIYKMTGTMVTLPEDEDTPEKVRRSSSARSATPADPFLIALVLVRSASRRSVDSCTRPARPTLRPDVSLLSLQIFDNMDKDKNASLDYNEFVEGSKKDPTIVQVRLGPARGLVLAGKSKLTPLLLLCARPSRSTTASSKATRLLISRPLFALASHLTH